MCRKISTGFTPCALASFSNVARDLGDKSPIFILRSLPLPPV
nr:MAG TPA: hypothetical protein [Caudoviricetes sp.]